MCVEVGGQFAGVVSPFLLCGVQGLNMPGSVVSTSTCWANIYLLKTNALGEGGMCDGKWSFWCATESDLLIFCRKVLNFI